MINQQKHYMHSAAARPLPAHAPPRALSPLPGDSQRDGSRSPRCEGPARCSPCFSRPVCTIQNTQVDPPTPATLPASPSSVPWQLRDSLQKTLWELSPSGSCLPFPSTALPLQDRLPIPRPCGCSGLPLLKASLLTATSTNYLVDETFSNFFASLQALYQIFALKTLFVASNPSEFQWLLRLHRLTFDLILLASGQWTLTCLAMQQVQQHDQQQQQHLNPIPFTQSQNRRMSKKVMTSRSMLSLSGSPRRMGGDHRRKLTWQKTLQMSTLPDGSRKLKKYPACGAHFSAKCLAIPSQSRPRRMEGFGSAQNGRVLSGRVASHSIWRPSCVPYMHTLSPLLFLQAPLSLKPLWPPCPIRVLDGVLLLDLRCPAQILQTSGQTRLCSLSLSLSCHTSVTGC